jgi:hypothetical protein
MLICSKMTVHPDPACKLSANLYNIPLLCVQWKTPDGRQRNSPKHVEPHSKNKFEKLVHLVGFIVRNTSHTFNKIQKWCHKTEYNLPWSGYCVTDQTEQHSYSKLYKHQL